MMPDNEGPNSSTGKCGTKTVGPENAGLENAVLQNAGPVIHVIHKRFVTPLKNVAAFCSYCFRTLEPNS